MQWILFTLVLTGLSSTTDIHFLIYIYIIVDAKKLTLKILLPINFNNLAIYMDGTINYDRYEILMVYYWFASVTTEKSIRRDCGRFNGIVKTSHNILNKA